MDKVPDFLRFLVGGCAEFVRKGLEFFWVKELCLSRVGDSWGGGCCGGDRGCSASEVDQCFKGMGLGRGCGAHGVVGESVVDFCDDVVSEALVEVFVYFCF